MYVLGSGSCLCTTAHSNAGGQPMGQPSARWQQSKGASRSAGWVQDGLAGHVSLTMVNYLQPVKSSACASENAASVPHARMRVAVETQHSQAHMQHSCMTSACIWHAVVTAAQGAHVSVLWMLQQKRTWMLVVCCLGQHSQNLQSAAEVCHN